MTAAEKSLNRIINIIAGQIIPVNRMMEMVCSCMMCHHAEVPLY